MSDVAFVFTNPRHHLEMMAPVADELIRRGIVCKLISLAELRGFDTPKQPNVLRAIPINVRRRSQPTSASSGEERWRPGKRSQKLVWHLGLGPRMRHMLAGYRIIVVPNDA